MTQSFTSLSLFGPQRPRRVRHCFFFYEEGVDRVRHPLGVDEVVELCLIFLEHRLSLPVFSTHWSNMHSWPPQTTLAVPSFFFLFCFFEEYCNHRGVIVPSRAPSQLQPYSGSDQDSTQVPPRQHFRGAKQCSRCESRFLLCWREKVASPT